MKRKKTPTLLAGLLAGLLLLGGCAQEVPEEPVEEPVVIVNDGRESRLVLGELTVDARRTRTLEEIAEKYTADYPNTAVEVRGFASPEALRAAVEAGEVQIADVTERELAGYVRDGLLLDMAEYLPGWSDSVTLLSVAQRVSGAVDSSRAYLLPSDAVQDVLYYRTDWFEAYNEGKESKEMVYARTWDQLIAAAERLGDRGRLAIAGRDRLVDYFDSMMWSSLALGRTLDPGLAYYFPSDPVTTVFRHEKAAEGEDQFLRVMTQSVLPRALDFTEQEALDAFLNGEACFLLADRSVLAVLEERMPPDSWAAREYPLGIAGIGVSTPTSFRGWGIAAGTADWENAFHFLTFLSNADNNTHYAKVNGTLPIHSTATALEPSFLDAAQAPELAMAKRPDWYQYALEPTLYEAWDGYRELANDWLRQYLAGNITQEDLLNRLDGYWRYALDTEGPRWE